MVQEEELGVKEFQMAVLSALLSLMKEQESLNNTLKTLTEKEKKRKLDVIDNMFTDDSSDEEDKARGKKVSEMFWVTEVIFVSNKNRVNVEFSLQTTVKTTLTF